MVSMMVFDSRQAEWAGGDTGAHGGSAPAGSRVCVCVVTTNACETEDIILEHTYAYNDWLGIHWSCDFYLCFFCSPSLGNGRQ